MMGPESYKGRRRWRVFLEPCETDNLYAYQLKF